MRVLYVFIDGVGYGPAGGQNPVCPEVCPTLCALMEGAVRLDACLGVPGLPQSATGQATLYTGVNAAQVMGRHKGIHHYTLGQRRGLGVSGPHRYFVSAIRPECNQVVLSDGTDLHADAARCTDLNWIALPNLTAPRRCTVRLRHSKTETPAVIHPTEGGVEIHLLTPARAPTPGQLAVFYDGESVLGSGWIC